MEFCLLGPVMVRAGDVVVPVPRGKQRAVLAALLLRANRTVPVDELIETLWGPSPPPSARVTMQNYVKRLRKVLGDTGCRISTKPNGYLMRVDASELDVTQCEAFLSGARTAARGGAWETAAAQARAALSLWRDAPLADVDSDLLARREIPGLLEMRLQTLEVRIDADLHLGRHAEVITELRHLASTYPLRERLHSLLMLALYRDGRQAEALATYQRARSVLVEELGAEPGTLLQELHQRILSTDFALAVPEPPRPVASSSGPTAPRELPATVRHFTGRAHELAALTTLLGRSGEQVPRTMVISAIAGAAGVGKTALVLHWAHQAIERFPHGQLYVNLRGYDAAQRMTATDALARLLRALGVPGQEIPPDEDERAARYRSLLAGRRMLVVLDNAGSVEQVRPVLPGTPTCTVVVISRDCLAGLVARDGATRLDLDVLPLEEAVSLLRTLIGARADSDPGATVELAMRCSRLPLALRVAAELATERPTTPLADLASQLADRQRRLDLLDAGGTPAPRWGGVSRSYQHLDADAARMFRLTGLQNACPNVGCSSAVP